MGRFLEIKSQDLSFPTLPFIPKEERYQSLSGNLTSLLNLKCVTGIVKLTQSERQLTRRRGGWLSLGVHRKTRDWPAP